MSVRALFPGTYDPIHYGHIDIANRASRLFEHLIIAVYDKPLKSLLFSPQERIKLTEQALENLNNVEVVGYSGLTVDFCRQVNVQVIIRGLRVFSDFEYEFRMALANQRLAPEIETVSFITHEKHTFLSSTTVREIASLQGDVRSMVPFHVEQALKRRFVELGDGQEIVPTNSMRD